MLYLHLWLTRYSNPCIYTLKYINSREYEEEYVKLYICGLQDMKECINTPGNMRWSMYCEPDVTRLPVDVVVAWPCLASRITVIRCLCMTACNFCFVKDIFLRFYIMVEIMRNIYSKFHCHKLK